MHNYTCCWCRKLIVAESKPPKAGCRAIPRFESMARSFGHEWVDCGPVGNDMYQCLNCGVLVHSDGHPTNESGCASDASLHNWVKL